MILPPYGILLMVPAIKRKKVNMINKKSVIPWISELVPVLINNKVIDIKVQNLHIVVACQPNTTSTL